MKSPFKRLSSDESLREILFHIRGIIEAQEGLASLAAQFDSEHGVKPEQAAQTAVNLHVEIFDHIGYHMTELREPFDQFIKVMFDGLESQKKHAKKQISKRGSKNAS